MKNKIGSVLMSVMLLTACESIDESAVSNINLEGKGYHLLFFSNENFINNEENYYDALLELKKNHPKEMANLYLIQSSKNNKVKKYKINSYPTLLVIKDGNVIERIEGKKTKKEIVSELSTVIR